MSDCIFCKIANKEIQSNIIYENEDIIAFEDLNPQAPVHILIIPKKHIESVDDINDENKDIIGEIFLAANNIAREKDLSNGYRIVNNCKEDGGQTVDHIHFHLLGGRKLQWPPG